MSRSDGRPPLLLRVVVRAVGVGQEAEAVGHRVQRQPERVRGAALEPADRPGGHAHQHHTRVPRGAHGLVHPVQPPQGQQVGHAAPHHPDHVLGQQVLGDVRDVGLGEQGQVAGPPPRPAERGVQRGQRVRRVAHGRRHDAHPGAVARPGEGGGVPVGGPEPEVPGSVPGGLEADAGGDDRRGARGHPVIMATDRPVRGACSAGAGFAAAQQVHGHQGQHGPVAGVEQFTLGAHQSPVGLGA